jgi:hypothetical protein
VKKSLTLGRADADKVGYLETAKADGQNWSVSAFGGNAEAYGYMVYRRKLNPDLKIVIREPAPEPSGRISIMTKPLPADIQALRNLPAAEGDRGRAGAIRSECVIEVGDDRVTRG